MAFSFNDIHNVPQAGEIVYCLWGGKDARPVLVYDKQKRKDTEAGEVFWVIWVFYGTSQFPANLDLSKYLVIEGQEVSKCGLDKRTRFDVSMKGVDWYPWTAEFFVAKPYFLSDGNPYVGTLSARDIAEMDRLYDEACKQGR